MYICTYDIMLYMSKYDKRIKARVMRKEGNSINIIARKLAVSKSSVSLWCRDVVLTSKQIEKLIQNKGISLTTGQRMGAETNKKKKQNNITFYRNKAREQLAKLSFRDLLIAGTALYWAEGAKTDSTSGFSFMNSDPRMIIFMKKFITSVMGVKEENIICTLQINRVHESRISKVLKFWSSLLKLPLKQFRKPYYVNVKHQKVYDNHDVYYGTLRLKVEKSSNLKYHMLGLIEALMST